MRKMPQVLLCFTLGAFGGCVPTEQVKAKDVPVPKPMVVDKGQDAPALEMDIRGVNGRMEAHFTNHTRSEVGVLVGDSILRLKPGQVGALPVPKVEKLRIFEFVDDGNGSKARITVETVISPKVRKGRFLVQK